MAGDGLLERARSAAFALFGLTAAIGLGLVLFISHLGWPNIPDIPIPGLPAEHMAVHNRAIVAAPAFQARSAVLRHRSLPNASAGAGGTAASRLYPDGSNHPRLSGSEQILVPSPPPGKGGGHPSGEGPSGAPSAPPPSAPAPPTPAPVASSPPVAVTATGHPGKGHGRGRGSSRGGDSTSKGGDHGHAPHTPVVTDEPPGQYPVDPGKDEPSPPQGDTVPSVGHGHGHGHDGR